MISVNGLSYQSLIMLTIFFIVSTLSFIVIYINISRYFGKRFSEKRVAGGSLTNRQLDAQVIERLRARLIDEGGMRNLEEIIYRLRMLRKEAEEILNDARRNKES